MDNSRVSNVRKRKNNYVRRNSKYSKTNLSEDKKEMFLFRVYVSIFMVLAVFCITKINTGVTNDISLRIKEAMSVQMSIETLKNISKTAVENGLEGITHGENLGEGTVIESSIPDNEIINEGNDLKN